MSRTLADELSSRNPAEALDWDPESEFEPGDLIRHADHGLGLVRTSRGRQLEADFADGVRRQLEQRRPIVSQARGRPSVAADKVPEAWRSPPRGPEYWKSVSDLRLEDFEVWSLWQYDLRRGESVPGADESWVAPSKLVLMENLLESAFVRAEVQVSGTPKLLSAIVCLTAAEEAPPPGYPLSVSLPRFCGHT